jgi:cobalt/nickel transport system permease protein
VIKLPVAVVFVCLIVAIPFSTPVLYAVAALVLAFIAALGRVPAGKLVLRTLVLEPFVLGVALMALFQPGGAVIFALMVVKSTLCLLTMVLLTLTTTFPEILLALGRFRVPQIMLTTLALTYRYLFVLVEEAERMRRARRSRSFSTGRLELWRSVASVIAQLFVRALERAERIYWSMCARGWKA